MGFADERAAVAALAAGTATLPDLREIVTAFPALRPVVAAYPAADGPLLQWLAALHDPVVDEQLARRAAAAAPMVNLAKVAPSAPTQVALSASGVSASGLPAGAPRRRSRAPLVIAIAVVTVLALGAAALALTVGSPSRDAAASAGSTDLAVSGTVPGETQAVSPIPSAAPDCPSGMSPVSWTKYADGSILLCRSGRTFRVVFRDSSRSGWTPTALQFIDDGYVLTFGNGGTILVGSDGSFVMAARGSSSHAYIAQDAWTPAGGELTFADAPSDPRSCPTGSWPISLSTYDGGWLLVCGTGSGATYLAGSDAQFGPFEADAVSGSGSQYCADTSPGRICVYASPAVISLTASDGTLTQRSVADNWFAGIGGGGVGEGTGSYNEPAPDDTASDQVRYLLGILNKSAAARHRLNPAVAKVSGCRQVGSAVATIAAVGQNRRDLLDSLDSTPVDQIPDGTVLVTQLRAALSASRDADDAWLRWAKSERDNGCAHGSDSALYQKALAVNRLVDAPKEAFVSTWNSGIAPQFGVQTFTRDQI